VRHAPGRIRLGVLALVAALGGVATVPAGRAAAAPIEGDAHGPAGIAIGRRVLASGLRGPEPVALAVGTGYGYTEPVLGLEDRHHRLLGALLAEAAVRPWLGLGLRLDGRYDRHAFGDGRPSDDGWVGEPRLYGRVDGEFGQGSSAGGRITLFLPGADAPSIEAGAVSAEALALLSHRFARTTLALNAGYRLDRSGQSAGNADELAPGDRLALGVSDFHAGLLGAAVHHDLEALSLFTEVSWEMLVGSGAPAVSAWPLRFGAGARRRLSAATHVEVLAEVSPSARPSMLMGAPLSPVPPRVGFMAELVVALGGAGPAKSPPDPDRLPPSQEILVPRVEVELAAGAELPADARIVLQQGENQWVLSQRPDGRFSVAEVPAGAATITATASGYKPRSEAVRLMPGRPTTVKLALERDLPSGQIRGTVRAFDGRPLTASVRLTPRPAEAGPSDPALAEEEERRSDGGAFQFDVPPGRYRVTIGAPGHEAQTRTVEVEVNGVTVLNIDLRRAR
jgi:hypothetical protein